MGGASVSHSFRLELNKLFPYRKITEEWDARPNKRRLNSVESLDYIKVNIEDLRRTYQTLKDIPIGEFESHVTEQIKGIPDGFTKRYYSSVLSMPTEEAIEIQKWIDRKRGIPWWGHMAKLSKFQAMKALKYLNDDYNPLMDERNYTRLHPLARKTYIEKIIIQFKNQTTRIRFAILRPGEEVAKHIDIPTQYATRTHLPVITNGDCFLHFVEENKVSRYHLNEGDVYRINGGHAHWASNLGKTDRIHLIICTDGPEGFS